MAINRYAPNSKLTRLKMELEEAELEFNSTNDSRRKERIQIRIDNIKHEIKEIEDEIDRIYNQLDG